MAHVEREDRMAAPRDETESVVESRLNPAQRERLGRLIEELVLAVRMVTLVLRHGYEARNGGPPAFPRASLPSKGPMTREALAAALGHVGAQALLLECAGDLQSGDINVAYGRKLDGTEGERQCPSAPEDPSPDRDRVKQPVSFRQDLESLLNRHSMENGSNTPDFILANFLVGVLETFDTAVLRRHNWYDRDAPPEIAAPGL